MNNILNITEGMKIVGYLDVRSFLKFCTSNQIEVFYFPNTSKRFVLAEEFYKAVFTNAIPYLYKKYGKDKFPEAFTAHTNVYSQSRLISDRSKKNRVTEVTNNSDTKDIIPKKSNDNKDYITESELYFFNRLAK